MAPPVAPMAWATQPLELTDMTEQPGRCIQNNAEHSAQECLALGQPHSCLTELIMLDGL